MIEIKCKNCGANELQEISGGFLKCPYCNTKYKADFKPKESVISVSDDVAVLLEKCRKNPRNARKFANLILDIDPDNEEVKKYL